MHHLQQIVHVLEISFDATFVKGGQRRGRLHVHSQRCKALSTNGSHGSPFTGARDTTSTYRALWVVHAIAKQPFLVMSEDMCQLSPCGLLYPAPEATVVSSTQSNLNSCIELDDLIAIAAVFSRTQSPASLLQERERFNDDDFTSDGTADCHKMVAHLKKDKGWFRKSRLISRTYLDLGLFVP